MEFVENNLFEFGTQTGEYGRTIRNLLFKTEAP